MEMMPRNSRVSKDDDDDDDDDDDVINSSFP